MNQPLPGNDDRNDVGSGHPAGSAAAGGKAVLGPFSVREVVIFASLLVILIASIVPFSVDGGWELNLWNSTTVFFLGVGVLLPLGVGALLAARRLSPGTALRIGSLSLDQFASVSAVLALAYFLVQFSAVLSASLFVCLLGALVFFAATVLAPHIPGFSADFGGRAETPAHRVARDAAALTPRPKAPAAPAQAGAPGRGAGAAQQDPRAAGRSGGQAGAPAPGPQAVPAGRGSADGAAAAAGAGAAAAAGAGIAAAEAGQAAHASGAQPQQRASAPAQAGAAAPAANSAATGAEPAAQGTPVRAETDRAETGRDGAAPADARRNDAEAGAPAGVSRPEVSGGDTAGSGSGEGTTVQAGQEEALPATTAHPVVSSDAHPRTESISAVRDENDAVVEAFWFAVGTPRQIVDERTGLPLFMFYPGDWELGLEDRGHEFLVQDKRTGRIGVLRDLSNIERVSSDEN